MHSSTIAIVVGFVVVVVFAVLLVRKTRSYLAQVFLAAMLLFPAAFCLFGFAATFEPMDAVTQWTFRIGYSVIGVSLAGTILMLLLRRPSSPGNEPSESDAGTSDE